MAQHFAVPPPPKMLIRQQIVVSRKCIYTSSNCLLNSLFLDLLPLDGNRLKNKSHTNSDNEKSNTRQQEFAFSAFIKCFPWNN